MTTRIKEILFIVVGTAIYAFGLVYLNIANHLAEGGVTGITLIIRALLASILPTQHYSSIFH